MRPSIKISLLFAGIWFLGKMIFFYGQVFQDAGGVKFLIMWNILCLLLGMSIGTLLEKRTEDRAGSSALGDIKQAMSGGMVYTVLVAGLLYLYYAKIDPAYNENQIQVNLNKDRETLNDPIKFEKIKRENPELESKTKEEILKDRNTSYHTVFSASSTMTLSLLGMLLLTTINSIILTVIFRRVLFKQRTL